MRRVSTNSVSYAENSDSGSESDSVEEINTNEPVEDPVEEPVEELTSNRHMRNVLGALFPEQPEKVNNIMKSLTLPVNGFIPSRLSSVHVERKLKVLHANVYMSLCNILCPKSPSEVQKIMMTDGKKKNLNDKLVSNILEVITGGDGRHETANAMLSLLASSFDRASLKCLLESHVASLDQLKKDKLLSSCASMGKIKFARLTKDFQIYKEGEEPQRSYAFRVEDIKITAAIDFITSRLAVRPGYTRSVTFCGHLFKNQKKVPVKTGCRATHDIKW